MIHGFVWAMPSRRTINFPESGRSLGHVTPKFFGSTVGYPSDSLASCLSTNNAYMGFRASLLTIFVYYSLCIIRTEMRYSDYVTYTFQFKGLILARELQALSDP